MISKKDNLNDLLNIDSLTQENIGPEDEIRNQSVKYINQISDKANEEEFQVEEFEDSTGLRTTSEYDKDASMIGGFRS